jgi:hypothetical protein
MSRERGVVREHGKKIDQSSKKKKKEITIDTETVMLM